MAVQNDNGGPTASLKLKKVGSNNPPMSTFALFVRNEQAAKGMAGDIISSFEFLLTNSHKCSKAKKNTRNNDLPKKGGYGCTE